MLQSIFLIEHPGQVSSTQVYIHFAESIQISLFSSPDKRIFNVNNEHPSVIVVDLASPLIGITLGKYFFERVFPQPGSCSSADVNGFRKMAEDRRRGRVGKRCWLAFSRECADTTKGENEARRVSRTG